MEKSSGIFDQDNLLTAEKDYESIKKVMFINIDI
jgi:hypothetical protein